jgi:hypothetical protein
MISRGIFTINQQLSNLDDSDETKIVSNMTIVSEWWYVVSRVFP